MIETLRAQVQREKAQKVRETAMKRFGYSKGSISKAINVALDEWLMKQGQRKKERKPDWGKIRGALKDIKMDSVTLQHAAFEFAYKKKFE